MKSVFTKNWDLEEVGIYDHFKIGMLRRAQHERKKLSTSIPFVLSPVEGLLIFLDADRN